MPEPTFPQEPTYTPFERGTLARAAWFTDTQSAYLYLQSSRPLTLGLALHDSPLGLLSWLSDKLLSWSDAYAWTPTELITFTLLHYFPGPTTGMQMNYENGPESLFMGESAKAYVQRPVGVSAFAKEVAVVPRVWAETRNNVAFWREHERGGHFAAYERPEALVGDLVEFFRGVWEG